MEVQLVLLGGWSCVMLLMDAQINTMARTNRSPATHPTSQFTVAFSSYSLAYLLSYFFTAQVRIRVSFFLSLPKASIRAKPARFCPQDDQFCSLTLSVALSVCLSVYLLSATIQLLRSEVSPSKSTKPMFFTSQNEPI